MDFSKVSFDASWSSDQTEMEDQRSKAMLYAVLFVMTSTSLIVAIVRTIYTNPGNIPDHKEWDMSTDTSAGEESASILGDRR